MNDDCKTSNVILQENGIVRNLDGRIIGRMDRPVILPASTTSIEDKEMDDRSVICGIISDMLDNPDESEIYPTSTAYGRLETYIQKVRIEAIGWMHAYACLAADRGEDVRLIEVPEILDAANRDLLKHQQG